MNLNWLRSAHTWKSAMDVIHYNVGLPLKNSSNFGTESKFLLTFNTAAYGEISVDHHHHISPTNSHSTVNYLVVSRTLVRDKRLSTIDGTTLKIRNMSNRPASTNGSLKKLMTKCLVGRFIRQRTVVCSVNRFALWLEALSVTWFHDLYPSTH